MARVILLPGKYHGPLTLAVLGGAAGGVGSEAVRMMWDSVGRAWFERYFENHGRQAILAGRENTVAFLSGLALRIDHLERTLPSKLEAALSDPDFSSTLRTALLAAVRTSNGLKHEALVRAVTERLTAEPESQQAVASNMAVHAIPNLSRDHLALLRVLRSSTRSARLASR